MSDVANCPTCGATCRMISRDREGLLELQASQNTDAQSKIEQLKKSLYRLRETLQTEWTEAKVMAEAIEQLKNAPCYFQEQLRTERAADGSISNELSVSLSQGCLSKEN